MEMEIAATPPTTPPTIAPVEEGFLTAPPPLLGSKLDVLILLLTLRNRRIH